MFTIENFEEYQNENRKDLQNSFMSCQEVPTFMKRLGSEFETMWNSGCWLKEELLKLGAKDKEADDICFVQGQKSFTGDTVKIAIELLNEYAKNNKVKDKPGIKLAEKIHTDLLNSNSERQS